MMFPLQAFLQSSTVADLGWTLIHFVWQGSVLALILACTLRAMRRHRGNLRYAAACLTMLLMLGVPLFSLAQSLATNPPASFQMTDATSVQNATSQSPLVLTIPASKSQDLVSRFLMASSSRPSKLNDLLPLLTLAWCVGVAGFSFRMFGGWWLAHRLATRNITRVADEWQQRLSVLCQQLGLSRKIGLFESLRVGTPTVVGWLRPVILIPASAFSGLSPAQLESVLAHELAHIRRHDYLVNLLQAVVETVFFYHPAVWWVSRQIRNEREICCDDLAVEICGDALTYARALLHLEQLRIEQSGLAMAANGGDLMKRIQRLVVARPAQPDRVAGVLAATLALAAIFSAAVGARISSQPLTSGGNPSPSSVSIAAAKNTLARTVAAGADSQRRSPEISTMRSVVTPDVTGSEPVTSSAPAQTNPTIGALSAASPADRAAAACALGKAGAVEAIPGLVTLLRDDTATPSQRCWNEGDWSPARDILVRPSPGEEAAIALASFGEASLDALVAALANGNTVTRTNAAWAIGEMRGGNGVNREAAIEPLIAALGDSNEWVRYAAAFSIGELRPRAGINPLIASLADTDANVREMAANSLGELKAKEAIEALKRLLSDTNSHVRSRAAWALREITDGHTSQLIPNLLNDSERWAKSIAYRAVRTVRRGVLRPLGIQTI